MKTGVYAIYDNVAKTFPFGLSLMSNDDVAKRYFKDLFTMDNQLSKHPEDYSLYFLSSFDTDTGRFFVVESIIHVADGKDYIQQN